VESSDLDQSAWARPQTRTKNGSIFSRTKHTITATNASDGPPLVSKASTLGSMRKAINGLFVGPAIDGKDPVMPCKVFDVPRDPTFSGREPILSEIENAILPPSKRQKDSKGDSAAVRVFTLSGPPDIWKTSIASEFVHRHEKVFDAMFWIWSASPTGMATIFSDIAVKLGLVEQADTIDQTYTRQALLGWLANPVKSFKMFESTESQLASWLIVFDDVIDTDALDAYWPKESTGSVLFTCQNVSAVKEFVQLRNHGIELAIFSKSEARKLLIQLTQRENDKDDMKNASAIVNVLERYPFVIAQMSRVILDEGLSFEKFLEMYSGHTGKKSLYDGWNIPMDPSRWYNESRRITLEIDRPSESRALLHVISLLDPDRIPEGILENYPAVYDWSVYPKISSAYIKWRSDLCAIGVISRSQEDNTLSIHKVIQDF
jgi:NB-ARC domain-containing protein